MQATSPLSLSQHVRPDQSSHPAPTPSLFLEGSLDLFEDAVSPAVTGTGGIDVDESGSPLPPLPGNTNHVSEPLLIPDSNGRALQRLVSRDVPQDELPSVIETIISNVKAADIVGCLQENDAQTFIDVMDEVCHHTIPSRGNWSNDLCINPPDFCRSGVRYPRFHNKNPKEMREIVIQGVCWSRTAPKITAFGVAWGSSGEPTAQRWIRRRAET